MSKYSVLVPFTGSMLVEVEADSAADAKRAAFEVEFDIDSVQEVDLHEHVVQGNVFYGILNSMEVKLINDDQPEDQ